MPATLSHSQPRFSRWPLVAAAVGGALLAVALGLWAVYGGAVFHQMIAAGIAWCF
jgi:hypothetical protein